MSLFTAASEKSEPPYRIKIPGIKYVMDILSYLPSGLTAGHALRRNERFPTY